MKLFHLKNFIGGWVVGNFDPSIIKTDQFEVAIKHYKEGQLEQRHLHKLAEEITIIVSGKVRMNSVMYTSGDIVFIDKDESTDFEVLQDTITCVIKIPSILNDKYII